MNLDDLEAVRRADRHDTRGALQGFADQCRAARALPAPAPPIRRPRAVVVAGMGGSAAGGDLLAAIATDTADVPIVVHRGYGLPAFVGSETLVLAVSYSGETEEVLSAAEAALARRAPVVLITSGGALATLAARRRLPLVSLPAGLMPRLALGYLLLPALAVLEAAGVVTGTGVEVEEAPGVLDAVIDGARPERATAANDAKRLALAIGERLAAVYGGPLTAALAYRWKTDLAENAKALALAGAVPEMNHNEIEAWSPSAPAAAHVVLLRDAGEPPAVARRFAILREMLAPAAGAVSEAWSRGQGRLARLLSLACLGGWVSYYVALLRGVDPWEVPRLDEVKRRMRDGGPPRA